MAHALIVTARPGGGLSFDGNDVIQVLDADQHPGAAVSPASSGFLFCYVSDRAHDDPDLVALMAPRLNDDADLLDKRRYQLILEGTAFEAWVPAGQAQAVGMQKTWAEVQDLIVDKET